MSRKRSYTNYLGDQPRLQIRLAGEQEQQGLGTPPACCPTAVLVAAGLPAQVNGQDVWDLSNVLVDGAPVDRVTVVAWLNACYQ
jgi:hypothetical protein